MNVQPMTTPDLPVEHLHVRRHNLSLVLRMLATQGPRSRASVAAATGLTRATVSSLTSELIELGLVRELGPDAGRRRGRPATLLELDGSQVVTIGVELNVGFIAVLGRDLGGRQVYDRRVVVDTDASGDEHLRIDGVIKALSGELVDAICGIEHHGRRVVGITVAVPGVVDVDRGEVRIAPNLGWQHVPILARLRPSVTPRIELGLENESNLGAVAELRAGGRSGTANLVYVLAERGVGGGIVVNGNLLRGASGAAGEIGHMTVQPVGGERCGCGSLGCWETLIGLPAVLRRTLPERADALLADHSLDLQDQVAYVASAARAGDPVALAGLRDVAEWVGLGIANLIDVFDPEAVVLAGTLHDLGELILDDVVAAVERSSLPDALHHCRIEVSTLGFSAAALGGAIHAAERLFSDPTLVAG